MPAPIRCGGINKKTVVFTEIRNHADDVFESGFEILFNITAYGNQSGSLRGNNLFCQLRQLTTFTLLHVDGYAFARCRHNVAYVSHGAINDMSIMQPCDLDL